jgi:hypothetical protein
MSALESALRIVEEHGYPVLPCDNQKRPVVADWTAFEARDANLVERLFDRPHADLVGVRTGAASGLFVVDVDPAGGEWLTENFERLACRRLHSTRRAGGRHLFYKIPPGYRVRNSAGKLARGVDTRGEGGQVIWWPEFGGAAVMDDAPGPPPGWLLEELERLGVADHLNGKAVERIADATGTTIAAGGRNVALTREAGRLRRLAFEPPVIEAALLALNDARCQPALSRDEVLTIARSVARYEPAKTDGDSSEPAPVPPAPIDWAGLKGSPPPRTWWLQDWLTPAPTMLAGGGGIGKSLMIQTTATALTSGVRYFTDAVASLRVLIWSCEDDHDEIWRRQEAICRHLGIELADLAGKLTIVPRVGHENTLLDLVFGKPTFTPLLLELREQVNDLHADILVLDNLGQVYGGNESDRHQATLFVNGVHGIVRGRPFAPIFCGHVARTQGSEYSGSAAWENACRMRWYLGRHLPDQRPEDDIEGDPEVVYLAKRKANYTSRDFRKFRYSDGLFLPEDVEGVRFDQANRNDIAERVVLKALGRLRTAGINATDGVTSPDYLPKQVVAKGYAEDHTKQELAAAMNRLMGAGRLKREIVGKYSSRAPRYGLVEVPR